MTGAARLVAALSTALGANLITRERAESGWVTLVDCEKPDAERRSYVPAMISGLVTPIDGGL